MRPSRNVLTFKRILAAQWESGSFDILLHTASRQLRPSRPKHVLNTNDGFVNLLLSIGLEQFRICGHLVSHLVQSCQYVFRFIHDPLHGVSMKNTLRGRSDGYHLSRLPPVANRAGVKS